MIPYALYGRARFHLTIGFSLFFRTFVGKNQHMSTVKKRFCVFSISYNAQISGERLYRSPPIVSRSN